MLDGVENAVRIVDFLDEIDGRGLGCLVRDRELANVLPSHRLRGRYNQPERKK